MKTRVYPTSRKLFGLLGDVTIITLTYILLTYLIIPPGARAMNQALYSGMLPVAVIFSVMACIPSSTSDSAKSSSAWQSVYSWFSSSSWP